MKTALTARQQQVLDFITAYMRSYTSAPTIREIAEEFGFFHNAAQEHVLALERKGWVGIRRRSGTTGHRGSMSRGIFLCHD